MYIADQNFTIKKSTLKHSSLDRVYIVLTINGIRLVYKRHLVTKFEQGVRGASAVLVMIKFPFQSFYDPRTIIKWLWNDCWTVHVRSAYDRFSFRMRTCRYNFLYMLSPEETLFHEKVWK